MEVYIGTIWQIQWIDLCGSNQLPATCYIIACIVVMFCDSFTDLNIVVLVCCVYSSLFCFPVFAGGMKPANSCKLRNFVG